MVVLWDRIGPLVVVYVAGPTQILIWQLGYSVCFSVLSSKMQVLGALGIAGASGVFENFWAVGRFILSPVPFFCIGSVAKGARGHQSGGSFWLVLVGAHCSLWGDPFLFLGGSLLWTVMRLR